MGSATSVPDLAGQAGLADLGVHRQELEAPVDVAAAVPDLIGHAVGALAVAIDQGLEAFGLFDGMHVGALQVLGDLRAACFMQGAVARPTIAAPRRRRWPKTASWPAVEPSTLRRAAPRSGAREQVVDPALGLDAGGEFLERDLVEAAARVAWLLGRSPRRGSKMVSVVTRPRSGPTNSTSPARRQWHIDIAHAPGWGTKFWNIGMGATVLFWWPAYLPHRVGRPMRQTTPPRKGSWRRQMVPQGPHSAGACAVVTFE